LISNAAFSNLENGYLELILKLLESRWGGVWRLVWVGDGVWDLMEVGNGEARHDYKGIYDPVFEISIRDPCF